VIRRSVLRRWARREREDFAGLLTTLTEEQWAAPSLCPGWTVRDVAAHTVGYLGQSLGTLTVNMVRHRGDVDRLNDRLLSEYSDLEPVRLIELMHRRAAPSGAAALYGGRVALIECVVHQQDIRRPLGMPRSIPEDALRASLNYARISPVIGGARRTRGVRLEATDMEWAAGNGRVVRGSGEALLLAMTGRISAVHGELAGDGLAELG
jgi:uncharacterized protein (TIGR03083 family)